MYEDDTTDEEGSLAEKSEGNDIPVMATGFYRQVPTTQVNNYYLNSSVMFPRGNTYAGGEVIGRKRDADRNVIERMNENPVLDTSKYFFEFDDGEVINLTKNAIAESMYYACNDAGNEYLIMELILDYHNNYKAITVISQKLVHRGWSFMRIYIVVLQLCVQ